jgi:acyl carrier protein
MPLDIRLENVIRRVFSIDANDIDENWTSEDIPEWDSTGHLILILEIEKEFGIDVGVEDMFEVTRLGDLAQVLKKKGIL